MAKKTTDKNIIQGINWKKHRGWMTKPQPVVPEWDPEAHPEHVYHGAPVTVRENIAKNGIIGNRPHAWGDEYDTEEPGVFIADTPEEGYGPDIWAIKPKVYPSASTGIHYFFPGNIHVSDIKRVGHWWTNPNTGGQEVHWHREEDCWGHSVHEQGQA